MFARALFLLLLCSNFNAIIICQSIPEPRGESTQSSPFLFGFVRAGSYAGFDQVDNKPYISSAYADLALKVDLKNGVNYRAFADLRFRYGAEFLKQASLLDIKEAWIKVYGKGWEFSAGQQIVNWGRADFTNPTSALTPENLISRSPDREDADMGNLIASFNWNPDEWINIEAVAIPFYRSSVLVTDPLTLPEYVSIREISSLLTGEDMFGYGFKADFFLNGFDWSVSFSDVHNPMPGAELSGFSPDLTGTVPFPETELTLRPYRERTLGLDFETTIGIAGIRGEASWSVPCLSHEVYEFVPLPEINWVGGFDWSSGIWRFIGEYSGKHISNFKPSSSEPVIGTEIDYQTIAQLLLIPGFDLEEYVRQQVGAFNRLYNYQLKKFYHSGAFRIEADLKYGKITPSLFSMYNFSSRDLILIPEIRFKPSDGLALTAGAEYYHGCRDSLFDIIDDFMNSIYVSIRIDF